MVYAANVRVGTNISSVGEMLRLAMPEANIQATPMNNLVLLTGTVSNPDDVAEAQRLTQAYVGKVTQVISRLSSATPLQVMLKVRIAEVNRSMLKKVGVNLLNRDVGSGSLFGIGQGIPGTINVATGPTDPLTGLAQNGERRDVQQIVGGTTLGLFGHIFRHRPARHARPDAERRVRDHAG